MYEDYDYYDEYGDPDAMSCAEGDYNTWETEQVFRDNLVEYYGYEKDPDDQVYGYDEDDDGSTETGNY